MRLFRQGFPSNHNALSIVKSKKVTPSFPRYLVPCHTKELFALASQRVREGQLKCFQLVVHTPTSDQKRWEDASSRFLSEGEADEDKKEKKKKEEGADIIKEAQKRQNKKKMAEHTSLIAQQHPLALPHHKFMGPAIPC